MNTHVVKSIAVIITCFCSIASNAATFSVLCDNSLEIAARGCTIKLSGPIASGDADLLRSTLQDRLPNGWHYHTLLLDSPGGSVGAAIELAKVVRQAVLNTTTYRFLAEGRSSPPSQKRRQCISACFLVWVAGAERKAFIDIVTPNVTSDIGLHRPYLDKAAYAGAPEAVATMQQKIMQAVAEYLQREQIPQSLIEKMLQRASTQIYWLGPEDEEIVGRASWFEEMMIARCGFDPSYDHETEAWVAQSIFEYSKTGKPLDLGPRYSKYIEWRQEYNACEYGVREAAQAVARQ